MVRQVGTISSSRIQSAIHFGHCFRKCKMCRSVLVVIDDYIKEVGRAGVARFFAFSAKIVTQRRSESGATDRKLAPLFYLRGATTAYAAGGG